jgi:hypothetical protein
MPLYAAIDLHSNNNYLVVIDERDQVVFRRKQGNVLSLVLQALEPFRGDLSGIVVESTYNPTGPDLRLVLAGGRVDGSGLESALSQYGRGGAV